MAHTERELYILQRIAFLYGMSPEATEAWAKQVLQDAPEASETVPAARRDGSVDDYGAIVTDGSHEPVRLYTNSSSITVAGALEALGIPVEIVQNAWLEMLTTIDVGTKRHRIINQFLHNTISLVSQSDGSASELSGTDSDSESDEAEEKFIPEDWNLVAISDKRQCDLCDRVARWEREGAYYCKFHKAEQVERDRAAERDQ